MQQQQQQQQQQQRDTSSCSHAAAAAGAHAPERQQLLVTIRHGRRLDSVDPSTRLTSSSPWDSPLAPGWMEECVVKAQQLQGISFGLVLVSPFTRCAQTAAGLIPHLTLDPDARISFHRGLSELFFPRYLFFPRPASTTQQLSFWWWKKQRNHVLPQFATMGGVAVAKKVLGSWPTLPETAAQARARLEVAVQEALSMAGGRNVLLVSHAAAVEYSVYRMQQGLMPDNVAFLGHTVTRRRHSHPDKGAAGGSNAGKQEGGVGGWQLEAPGPGSGVLVVDENKVPPY